jgi:hypothetical protein
LGKGHSACSHHTSIPSTANRNTASDRAEMASSRSVAQFQLRLEADAQRSRDALSDTSVCASTLRPWDGHVRASGHRVQDDKGSVLAPAPSAILTENGQENQAISAAFRSALASIARSMRLRVGLAVISTLATATCGRT